MLAAVLLAGGCDDGTAPTRDAAPESDAPDDVRDPNAPVLEIGTGGTAYEAVADGGPVELVHGPQGGYHVLLAARFRGLDPDGLLLSYQVFRADGATALNERFSVRLGPSTVTPSGMWFLRTGDLGVLSIAGPADVEDMDAEVHADALAADGDAASAVLRIHIVDEIGS